MVEVRAPDRRLISETLDDGDSPKRTGGITRLRDRYLVLFHAALNRERRDITSSML